MNNKEGSKNVKGVNIFFSPSDTCMYKTQIYTIWLTGHFQFCRILKIVFVRFWNFSIKNIMFDLIFIRVHWIKRTIRRPAKNQRKRIFGITLLCTLKCMKWYIAMNTKMWMLYNISPVFYKNNTYIYRGIATYLKN